MKTGRGGPFWKSFWDKKVLENPSLVHIKSNMKEPIARLRVSASSFSSSYKEAGKKYYLEAKLDDLANKKSKEPTELWKDSGIQIVESKDDGSVTLSGFGDDFEKLAKIVSRASFDVAAETKTEANNLSREVFSVTALSDKNASFEKSPPSTRSCDRPRRNRPGARRISKEAGVEVGPHPTW